MVVTKKNNDQRVITYGPFKNTWHSNKMGKVVTLGDMDDGDEVDNNCHVLLKYAKNQLYKENMLEGLELIYSLRIFKGTDSIYNLLRNKLINNIVFTTQAWESFLQSLLNTIYYKKYLNPINYKYLIPLFDENFYGEENNKLGFNDKLKYLWNTQGYNLKLELKLPKNTPPIMLNNEIQILLELMGFEQVADLLFVLSCFRYLETK